VAVLTNTSSDRVKRVRRLARRSARLETGLLLVEGPQACREAARGGWVVDLYWTDDAARRLTGIGSAVERGGGRLHEASSSYVDALSAVGQGLVAVARDPWASLRAQDHPVRAALTASRLAEFAAGRPGALVAVFEQIRDPGNAGAVIRAADAAGADLVAFADHSADPTAPKVVRASAGSYFHVPVVSVGAVEAVVGQLRALGLAVFGADSAGTVTLGGPDLPLGGDALAAPLAWVFGNEARGLSPAARKAVGRLVRIPIFGGAESLNVALAATLCLYAAAGARHA
jgi:TrmH family RNA methyltransferase